ncbi:hypothetical protein D3C86_2200580 [compost metagenome]
MQRDQDICIAAVEVFNGPFFKTELFEAGIVGYPVTHVHKVCPKFYSGYLRIDLQHVLKIVVQRKCEITFA